MQAFNKLASKNLAFEKQICRNFCWLKSASFSTNFALEVQDSKKNGWNRKLPDFSNNNINETENWNNFQQKC